MRVLSRVFRGKYLQRLRRLHAEGKLRFLLNDPAGFEQSVERSKVALQAAREGYGPEHARGQALCDEVQAILLRRAGDFSGAARLLAEIDTRPGVERDAVHRFIAHNSRAITQKLLGHPDDALRHFYAACAAAEQTGWAGPRIIALSNLGGYQQDLYNLEDARVLCEEALAAAQRADATMAVLASAGNLLVVYHAMGDMAGARDLVDVMLAQPADRLPGLRSRYALPMALGHLSVGEIDEALRYLEPGAVGVVADGDSMTFWAWLMARCLLAKGDAAGARAVCERTLTQRSAQDHSDCPFDTMALHRALADAAEQSGDAVAALACMRRAHALYEQLVGRSARARQVTLQVTHQLAEAQRERDAALETRRSVEVDHRRLADLNTALQAQIAETEMLHARLSEQALRDPLTGLHNRRYLFEMAPGLLELSRRQGTPLCVVLLDLDHFKLLNDTFGHAAGDVVLQRFSNLLTQMLRKSDVICRHGGEEFVALMPDIEAEEAGAVIARLLEAFQAQQSELGRRRLPRGSFSAGVAVFPRHGNTLEQLLSRADRGLYSAKNQGRARIEIAPRTGFGSLG